MTIFGTSSSPSNEDTIILYTQINIFAYSRVRKGVHKTFRTPHILYNKTQLIGLEKILYLGKYFYVLIRTHLPVYVSPGVYCINPSYSCKSARTMETSIQMNAKWTYRLIGGKMRKRFVKAFFYLAFHSLYIVSVKRGRKSENDFQMIRIIAICEK